MEGGSNGGRAKLTIEKTAVAAAVTAVLFCCQQERALGRMRAQIHARRRKTLHPGQTAGCREAVAQVCCTTGWQCSSTSDAEVVDEKEDGESVEDLRHFDDATKEYFWEKLRMWARVFRAIAIASIVDECPRDALPMSMPTAVAVNPLFSLLEAFDRGRPLTIEDAHVEQEDYDEHNCD